MSDYGDFCHEMRDKKKKYKEKVRFNAHKSGGIIDKLDELGAIELTDGVYRLGNDDIYPYRGWVRNYRTNQSCSLDYWFKHQEKDNEL